MHPWEQLQHPRPLAGGTQVLIWCVIVVVAPGAGLPLLLLSSSNLLHMSQNRPYLVLVRSCQHMNILQEAA